MSKVHKTHCSETVVCISIINIACDYKSIITIKFHPVSVMCMCNTELLGDH